MTTETLDKLYLEWSQFTGARTSRELMLIEALKLARARIEYLGAAVTNERHFLANQNEFLPRIDAVLAAVGGSSQ